MNSNQQRLAILTQSEIQDYFGLPRFTLEEREHYFSLSDTDHQMMQQGWSIHTKVNFILTLGYFKSRRMFYSHTLEDVSTDISYILAYHFPEHPVVSIRILGKTTRVQLQKLICQHLNYQRYDSVMAEQLAELAARVVKRSAKPVFILRALLSHLTKKQVITPAYSTFQDLIGRCLSDERKRICKQLEANLEPVVKEELTNLLSDESGGMHWITQLKKAPKDFSYTEIVRKSDRVKQLCPLYEFTSQWLPSLYISNESIRYYASLVEYYSVYKLRRFDPLIAYFYLLCYAYHRTHVINAKVIGTHEHESYFVFDLLYNNTTEIDPDRHSVDTHGTNQVNFWILYAFGYHFAPRYKNFPTKTEEVIGFEHPGKYDEEFLIKPI